MRPTFPLDDHFDRLWQKRLQRVRAHEQSLMAMLRDLIPTVVYPPVKIRQQVR